MRVRVRKRTQVTTYDKIIYIPEGLYPTHDFYEKVAEELGWKGKEDALWWLSKNNYIEVERIKDENDNL